MNRFTKQLRENLAPKKSPWKYILGAIVIAITIIIFGIKK